MPTRKFLPPIVAILLGGCALPTRFAQAPVQPVAPVVMPARVEVRQAEALPTLTLLAREGDPAAAIALSVATDAGAAETTALAALVEQRLRRAGFAWVVSDADADGYRLHALVDGPEQADSFIVELQHALFSPIDASSEGLAHLAEREKLRRSQAGPSGFEAIASCQGRAEGSGFDVTSPEGLARIETLRKAAHAVPRLSVAVVGPYAVNEAVTHRIASLTWPRGKRLDRGRIEAQAPTTVVTSSEKTRVTVALRVGDAAAARLAAERLGAPGSALASRLSTLTSPFRLDTASANARLRGGCLTATIEAEAVADEASAAKATAILLRELRLQLDEAAESPEARDVYRTVLAAEDPREAALLASWWSLAQPSQQANPPAPAIVAQLRSGSTTKRGDAGARFEASVLAFQREFDEPRLFPRVRLESGQGRFALLLASPCGTSLESVKDAGLTALTLMSAASAESNPRTEVRLEPWLSPDAMGLLAHARRLPGESASDLAARVAGEAGRALAGVVRASSGFHKARGLLLHELANQGSGFDLAVEALLPSHPSWITAHGRFDSVVRQGPEATALRARSLLEGPLALAVLVDESAEQAEIAARTLERHLPIGPAGQSCPSPGRPDPATFGLFHVDLDASTPRARATLAFPIPGTDPNDRENAALLVAALSGPNGLLARTLAGFPDAHATVRLQGGRLASALLLELHAPDDSIEHAVAGLRSLVQRLAEDALSTDEFERARTELRRRAFLASLDPRKRIVDLVSGSEAERAPTLEGARSLAARIFREESTVLVLARPKQP